VALGSDTELNIVITAENASGPALAAAGEEVQALEAKSASLGKTMGSVASGLKDVGAKMTQAITLPVIAIGAAAIKMGTDFQSNMELVRTQAGASQQEVDTLTKSVLELAKHSAQGPNELAQGLYHLESLGLRGADAMKALSTASQMASLGNANLEATTSALGAALVTGIKGTENMSTAAGILDATIGNGNMRMEELVAALSSGILPAAKNFGLTLTDVGAALATLTDNGMRADEAATRLRMTFSLIAAPTQKAQGALAEIGLGADELAKKMRSGGLVSAIDDLKSHLEKSGKSATEQARVLSDAFGGGRSSAAIMTLVEQSDRLATKFTAIGQQAGEFGDKVGATQETAAYKFHAAWAKVQADLVELGIKLLPIAVAAFEKIANAVNRLVDWFNHLSPVQQKMVGLFVLLAAVAGPVIGALGSILGIVVGIMTVGLPVIGIIAAIVIGVIALGAAAIYVYTHWTEVQKFFGDFWKGLVADVVATVNTVIGWFAYLGTHWFQIIGYMIGVWATLPIRMFFLLVDGVAMITSFLLSINWYALLAGFAVAIVNIGALIVNSIGGAFHYVTSLNWGQLLSNVGRGIGNSIIDLIQGAINGALSAIPGHPTVHLPHFATGVKNFKGGTAVVGERGKESVYLPPGSSVVPDGGRGAAAGGGGGSTINFYGDIKLDGADAVAEWSKRVLGRDTFLNSKGIAGSGI
jgi:TP901 family phage tail tape measure protein